MKAFYKNQPASEPDRPVKLGLIFFFFHLSSFQFKLTFPLKLHSVSLFVNSLFHFLDNLCLLNQLLPSWLPLLSTFCFEGFHSSFPAIMTTFLDFSLQHLTVSSPSVISGLQCSVSSSDLVWRVTAAGASVLTASRLWLRPCERGGSTTLVSRSRPNFFSTSMGYRFRPGIFI